jgi:hypothetical protein
VEDVFIDKIVETPTEATKTIDAIHVTSKRLLDCSSGSEI